MASSNRTNQPQYPNFPPYGPGWGWRRGWGRGWGPGLGRGRCFRFPWLPRWWWVYPEYGPEIPTPKKEKEMLKEEFKALQKEIKVIGERLKELETKKGKK